MRLLILPRFTQRGASSRLRLYQYIPALVAAGFDVTAAPLLDDRYLQRLFEEDRRAIAEVATCYLRRCMKLPAARRANIVLLEKELFPMLPALAERGLHALGARIVVDFDDAVFHTYDQHSSAVVRTLLGHKIDAVMHSATTVIAGNAYLADRARAAGARSVQVLPTAIDLDRYPPPAAPRSTGPLVVGWIGSPATQRYLDMVRDPISRFATEHAVRLVAIGATRVNWPGVETRVEPWSEATEVQALNGIDVGIMPLADGPFERGKCGYKLIQYMGCGKPVIASPVGVNTKLVGDDNGFLADGPEDWVRALRMLAAEPALRASMGHAGRERVESEYCLAVTAPRLVEILRAGARV